MPGLSAKVREVLLRERLIERGDMVIAAVSGGVDSLALLHILDELRMAESLPFTLYVAHLNHGLRGHNAREDATFVREEARRLGLPSTIGEVDARTFSRTRGLSLEDGARRLRYRFLLQLARRTGASRIIMGHHRDDQIETLLLNLMRGTGLDGLTGMSFQRPLDEGITLVRPMLEISRAEIEHFCREKGLTPRLDETNLSTEFTRNRIRLRLLPLLEQEFNPKVRGALQRLSSLLTPDREYLETMAAASFFRLLRKDEDHYLVLDGKALLAEHEALQGRILRLAVRHLLGTVPREIGRNHVQAIIKLQREGSPHGLIHLPKGLRVSRSYDNLSMFYRLPLRAGRFVPVTLPVPGAVPLPGTGLLIQAEVFSAGRLPWPPDRTKEAFLDLEQVMHCWQKNKGGTVGANLELLIRPRLRGDRFYPLGAPGRRKLKSYLIDRKIPYTERAGIPLVLAGDTIIWVSGQQISHCCRITAQTKQVLVLRLAGNGNADAAPQNM